MPYTASMIPAPKVKPPPKAQRPKRSPLVSVGSTSARQSGMLLLEVLPCSRILLYTFGLMRL